MSAPSLEVENERLLKEFSHGDGYRVELVEVSKSGQVSHFEVTSFDSKSCPRGVISGVEGGDCKVSAVHRSFLEAAAYFDCSSTAPPLPLPPEGSN